MARGKREANLIILVTQLDALDAKRRQLVAQIQRAASGLVSRADGGMVSSGSAARKGGRRPGFKLSAEARAKISAAQKKRWAKTKAAGK